MAHISQSSMSSALCLLLLRRCEDQIVSLPEIFQQFLFARLEFLVAAALVTDADVVDVLHVVVLSMACGNTLHEKKKIKIKIKLKLKKKHRPPRWR